MDYLNCEITIDNMVDVHRAMREAYIRRLSEASNELAKWQADINQAEASVLERVPKDIRTLSLEELIPELKSANPSQEVIDEQLEELNKKLDEYTDLALEELEKKRQILVQAQQAMNS